MPPHDATAAHNLDVTTASRAAVPHAAIADLLLGFAWHASLERQGLGLLLHERSDHKRSDLLVNLLAIANKAIKFISITTYAYISDDRVPGALNWGHFGSSKFVVNCIRRRCPYIKGTHGGA